MRIWLFLGFLFGSFLTCELAMRMLLTSGTWAPRVIHAREQLQAEKFFGDGQGLGSQQPIISLDGTSLAGGVEGPLRDALVSRGVDAVVWQDSAAGLYADQVARFLDNVSGAGHTLLELNGFTLNERAFLFANWSDAPVVKNWESTRSLFRLPDAGLRTRLIETGGIESYMGGTIAENLAIVFLGNARKGGLRSRVRTAILGHDRPLALVSPDQRNSVVRHNFLRKNFQAGDDTIVLRAFSGWICQQPDRARMLTVYFPPLAGAYIRSLTSERPSLWTEFAAFRRQYGQTLERCDVRVLDLTDLLESGAFVDYGHLVQSAKIRVADALASGILSQHAGRL